MPLTSSRLNVGQTYTREQLSSMFGITDATINTGIFQPKDTDSVWLFVTESKQPDRTQYRDRLEGDTLQWQGQIQGRKDGLIITHEAMGQEILLFYRREKYEFPHAAFRYEGPFKYVSHSGTRPTTFVLAQVVAGAKADTLGARLTGGAAPPIGNGPLELRSYFPEFCGTAQIRSSAEPLEADWEHGRVVAALHEALTTLGYSPMKNQAIDLCLVDSNGQLSALFEVKTDSAPYPIYTAIGQLLFHSREDSTKCVIVLPEQPDSFASVRIARLGIRVVVYCRGEGISIDREQLIAALR